MGFYMQLSMKFFGKLVEPYVDYFSDLKNELKQAKLGMSVEEYLSIALMTSFLVFVIELPLIALILALLRLGFLFSFITAITVSIAFPIIFFLAFINYPKFVIRDRIKNIEISFPFATTYLSTIASSNLPPHRIFKIFSKFEEYGEVTKEAKNIVADVELFGMDVNTAIEKAADRTPSKNLKEVLWGMLSTIKSGGDLGEYLRNKTKALLDEYRRKLYEFSHSLTVYMEVYLTALVIGAIFFIILTSVMSGMAGGSVNLVFLQFIIVFFIIPLISIAFIVVVKTISPGGE